MQEVAANFSLGDGLVGTFYSVWNYESSFCVLRQISCQQWWAVAEHVKEPAVPGLMETLINSALITVALMPASHLQSVGHVEMCRL